MKRWSCVFLREKRCRVLLHLVPRRWAVSLLFCPKQPRHKTGFALLGLLRTLNTCASRPPFGSGVGGEQARRRGPRPQVAFMHLAGDLSPWELADQLADQASRYTRIR